MGRGPSVDLPERNQKLYESYCAVIRKYGGLASKIKKITLYEEACEGFRLTPDEAGRIIRNMIKRK